MDYLNSGVDVNKGNSFVSIIKDITKKQILTTDATLSFKKNIFPNKIDKTIEIVIVPKLADITANQKNVGIILDEKLILEILSKRYRNVSN